MEVLQAVNAIRVLAAEQVQAANSGHPGLPLGAAPMAYSLWANVMQHNGKNPDWRNRDRFILSAGHGSAMLYALLHLFGYGLDIADLKQFRQLHSKTAGHPEYGYAPGIEATTGPLGAGVSMAVGMALAEAHLAARFNRDGFPIVDHHVYTLVGDGCLQEGISHEALSFAGTQKLDRLIVLYDSNNITIEGDTELAFQEDVLKRMEAYGFGTWFIEDGNDIAAITEALEAAKADTEKPSFIEIKTRIGYGSALEGSEQSHGAPLGEENLQGLKENLNWDAPAFTVPDEVYAHYARLAEKGEKAEAEWNALYEAYGEKYPELKAELESFDVAFDPESLGDSYWQEQEKPEASRGISSRVLNEFAEKLPNLIGGSADLGPSNKSVMKEIAYFDPDNRTGRNIHFGVREMAMTAIGNGLALYGGLKPYVATFLVFSDFMKPMIRLSALMEQPLTMILTHDSIGVGEDGPTHEPIEQLTMLRSMPNVHVWRPADETEVRAAWVDAMSSADHPTALALSRQNLPPLRETSKDAVKGAYIAKEEKGELELILLATGSELQLALAAAEELGDGVRVVSAPCLEQFHAQDAAYQEKVLPRDCKKRAVIEAGSSYSWGRLVGIDGCYITMDRFGASGPGDELFEHFGFTKDAVVEKLKEHFA